MGTLPLPELPANISTDARRLAAELKSEGLFSEFMKLFGIEPDREAGWTNKPVAQAIIDHRKRVEDAEVVDKALSTPEPEETPISSADVNAANAAQAGEAKSPVIGQQGKKVLEESAQAKRRREGAARAKAVTLESLTEFFGEDFAGLLETVGLDALVQKAVLADEFVDVLVGKVLAAAPNSDEVATILAQFGGVLRDLATTSVDEQAAKQAVAAAFKEMLNDEESVHKLLGVIISGLEAHMKGTYWDPFADLAEVATDSTLTEAQAGRVKEACEAAKPRMLLPRAEPATAVLAVTVATVTGVVAGGAGYLAGHARGTNATTAAFEAEAELADIGGGLRSHG